MRPFLASDRVGRVLFLASLLTIGPVAACSSSTDDSTASGATGGSSGSGGSGVGGSNSENATCITFSIVDYFDGSSVPGPALSVDGTPITDPSRVCLPNEAAVHTISITAPGHATYNGAIQIPGGAASRTISLFPVGPTLSGFLALVNSDRQANGAPPVALDNGLTIAAWDHAVDMGVQGYYAHFDPHGFAPTTRSLLLGSMVMGAESIAVEVPTFAMAEMEFMVEKAQLPHQSASDCDADFSAAGHYCNIVRASHNWVGLAVANVPGSPYGYYYDQEFGDLYGYYDTTVLAPEPALAADASVTLIPAPGETFQYEYQQVMPAPTPISIDTLNANPECTMGCPAGDPWYPTGNTPVSTSGPKAFSPPLDPSQLVFVALSTSTMAFVGGDAWAVFWGGGTVTPDSYGASSKSYLVP